MAAGMDWLGYTIAFTLFFVALKIAGMMLKHIQFNSSQVLLYKHLNCEI